MAKRKQTVAESKGDAVSVITYKYRIKDAQTRKQLQRMASAVNQVWNYCVATQKEAQSRYNAGAVTRWPSHFDYVNLTAGTSAEFGILSTTVSAVCMQFAASRDLHKRCPKFRVSVMAPEHKAQMLERLMAEGHSLKDSLAAVEAKAKSKTRRASLGWIPFRGRDVKLEQGKVRYGKKWFRMWQHRPLEGRLLTGSFVQDSRGRWYVTFQCEVPNNLPKGQGVIGIDLGLKTLATCSDGRKIENQRIVRQWADKLAIAQRAGNKARVRAIHAKIRNVRREFLHVESNRLARENSLVVVGNVNSAKLAKTKMAKSVLDAGWSEFRNQLRYKAKRHGADFKEVDERFTSQACSCCGAISRNSPKGMGGLEIRAWECGECGAVHDRDVNAARNILKLGLTGEPRGDEISAEFRMTVQPKQGAKANQARAP